MFHALRIMARILNAIIWYSDFKWINYLSLFQCGMKSWWREQRTLFQGGSPDPTGSAGTRVCEVEQLNTACGAADSRCDSSHVRTGLAFPVCTENELTVHCTYSLSSTDSLCVICSRKGILRLPFFIRCFFIKGKWWYAELCRGWGEEGHTIGYSWGHQRKIFIPLSLLWTSPNCP